MLQRRYHASFLLCVGIVTAALLSGCGATAAQQAAVSATATTPNCTGSAASLTNVVSLAELKHKSPVILVGTVVSTQARQDGICSVHTEATVRVDRLVHDRLHQVTGTTLVVATAGGCFPSGLCEGVEDAAQLRLGDQLVLFLFLVSPTENKYEVVDGEQGAPHIINGMVQSLSSGTMPLNAYIAQIELA